MNISNNMNFFIFRGTNSLSKKRSSTIKIEQSDNRIKHLDSVEFPFTINVSDNYIGNAMENQLVHFGASKKQSSLNTGFVYFKKKKRN